MDALPEEVGKLTVLALADKYLNYFVALTKKMLFECQSLGEMASPFTLDNEQESHDARVRAGCAFLFSGYDSIKSL